MRLYAQVLLDDPTGHTAAGELFFAAGMEWQPTEWLDPWACEHVATVCASCVETWQIDHEVALPDGI